MKRKEDFFQQCLFSLIMDCCKRKRKSEIIVYLKKKTSKIYIDI